MYDQTSYFFHTSETQVIAHPDKVEMFLLNSARNCDVLPENFPILTGKWTAQYALRWRHQLDKQNREWVINGWNDYFRVTFSGNAVEITDDLLSSKNPFSRKELSEIHDHHPYWYFGKIRITDRMKIKPTAYVTRVSNILRDIEVCGIQEMPRIIEYATDIYGDAGPFYNSVRLSKDNPLDFFHYRDADYYPGGSCSGLNTEYSMHQTFQPRRGDKLRKYNRYHRELVCYPRLDHNFYRIELRLGYRYLNSLFDSHAYPTAIGAYRPLTVTPTLGLLELMPYFVERHLKWEQINLTKLFRDYPKTKYWHLKRRSLRHIRYMLFKAGFSAKLVAKYTLPWPSPRIQCVLPSRFTSPT